MLLGDGSEKKEVIQKAKDTGVLNKNIYTGTYINSKKNYDKLIILINKFILKYKTKLEKIQKIYVNRGPGSYAGIRNSLSIVKAPHLPAG